MTEYAGLIWPRLCGTDSCRSSVEFYMHVHVHTHIYIVYIFHPVKIISLIIARISQLSVLSVSCLLHQIHFTMNCISQHSSENVFLCLHAPNSQTCDGSL